jgi:hypothetical protein
MGVAAEATSAPFILAAGSGICLVYALAMLVRIALTRDQCSTAPLR